MILKRREKPPFWSRMREFVAPRKGIFRGVDYIGKRMRRLPDSPHRIAVGFACGAFVSFSPFFGFHFFVAAAFAWLLRGNILASLFGTIVGNPITFPLISASALWTGRWILGRDEDGSDFAAVTHAFGEAFTSIWDTIKSWFGYGDSMVKGLSIFMHDVFLPYLIGWIPTGLIAGLFFYWLLVPIVTAYQERRRTRLSEIQDKNRAAIDAEQDAYAVHDPGEGDNA
ncbi:DUF2062 domain-containing protein [Rhodobacteraceae bacterium NNCM2]|nr:DUF2062 domain-containing protein [Coraliihabitans acroporae]